MGFYRKPNSDELKTPWELERYAVSKQIELIKEETNEEVFTLSLLHYAPTLACLKEYVGGYIECVYLPTGEQMICNEDGHRLELPFNIVASKYANMQLLGNVMFLKNKAMLT